MGKKGGSWHFESEKTLPRSASDFRRLSLSLSLFLFSFTSFLSVFNFLFFSIQLPPFLSLISFFSFSYYLLSSFLYFLFLFPLFPLSLCLVSYSLSFTSCFPLSLTLRPVQSERPFMRRTAMRRDSPRRTQRPEVQCP